MAKRREQQPHDVSVPEQTASGPIHEHMGAKTIPTHGTLHLLDQEAIRQYAPGKKGASSYMASDKNRLSDDLVKLIGRAVEEGYVEGRYEWPLTEFGKNGFQYLDKTVIGPAVALYWSFDEEEASYTLANRCDRTFNPLRYLGRSGEEIAEQVTGNNTHVGIQVSTAFASRIAWRFDCKGGPSYRVEARKPDGNEEGDPIISAYRVLPGGRRSEIDPKILDSKEADEMKSLKADRFSVTVAFRKPKA